MAYVNGQPQQVRGVVSAAPIPVKPLPPGAFTAQQGMDNQVSNNLQGLASALIKARLQKNLAGQLPGTTPASLGAGTAGSDLATGPQSAPLSLGGNSGVMQA